MEGIRISNSTAEIIQTIAGLTACVSAATDVLAAPVAEIQIANDPSVGDLASSVARVKNAATAPLTASVKLCAILNEAGENGIGSLSRITAAACQARIAESVFADLNDNVGR